MNNTICQNNECLKMRNKLVKNFECPGPLQYEIHVEIGFLMNFPTKIFRLLSNFLSAANFTMLKYQTCQLPGQHALDPFPSLSLI